MIKLMEFMKMLKLSQEDLALLMYEKLKKYYDDIVFKNGSYIWAKAKKENRVPYMLVGHLDTVRNEKNQFFPVYNSRTGMIANVGGDFEGDVLGGDDRCASLIILSVLEKVESLPDILLTFDEESGGIGVSQFCTDIKAEELEHINFVIEPDKSYEESEEIVWCRYEDTNDEIVSFLEQTGCNLIEILGSYSDIVDIQSTFGISGINIDAGYINQHTRKERINWNRIPRIIDFVINILSIPLDNRIQYKESEISSYYGMNLFQEEKYCDLCDNYSFNLDAVKIGEFKICPDCILELTRADLNFLLLCDDKIKEKNNIYCACCGVQLTEEEIKNSEKYCSDYFCDDCSQQDDYFWRRYEK